MALSEARRKSLLAYCKMDEPTEADLCTLETAYESAVGYLADAGISEPEAGSPRRARYDLCVNYMVLDACDLRDRTITGTIVSENPAFPRLVKQLQATEPLSGGSSKSANVCGFDGRLWK